MNTVPRPGTPEEAGLDPERLELVKKRCREWVDDGTHPALVVLVARRGVIALHEAYGRMGPEPDASPITTDTIFPLASISKVFVCTLLMTLVEDGLVGLTRPVQEYIPEFTGEGKELVCVHHLLTHTSGLRDEDVIGTQIERFGKTEIPPKEKTEHSWVHGYMWLGYDVPLASAPGQEMAYCTYNTDLVGEIVRRVSGCRYTDLCQERLFDPLGMSDTFYVLPDELFPRVVRREPGMFDAVPGIPVFGSRESLRLPQPAGGALSTTRDLAVFVQMFLSCGVHDGRRVLSGPTVDEMTRNQIPGIPASFFGEQHGEASWSYVWTIAGSEKWLRYPSFRPGVFSFMGATGTFMWGDPYDDLVGVYLSVPARYLPPVPPSPLQEPVFNIDLFASAVTAAVVD